MLMIAAIAALRNVYTTKQAFSEINGIITMFYVVRTLSPYTEYEFYVFAVNNIGRGPASVPATCTTGETGKFIIYELNLFFFIIVTSIIELIPPFNVRRISSFPFETTWGMNGTNEHMSLLYKYHLFIISLHVIIPPFLISIY